jgi:hypothetical protein
VEERSLKDRWHDAGQRLHALDLDHYVAKINESYGAKRGAN